MKEVCTDCLKEIEVPSGSFGTVYGVTSDGHKVCYSCCAERDKQELRETGKMFGYLISKPFGTTGSKQYFFTNWPASLEIKIGGAVKHSWHNFAGRDGRRDFWFTFEGNTYHGVNIGDQECATVRRVKR